MIEKQIYDLLTTGRYFNPITNTKYSYHYCENGIYILKNEVTNNKVIIQANSPHKAVEKLMGMT